MSGLSVFSEVALPGLVCTITAVARPDVTVRQVAVPHCLDGATQRGPTWEMTPERFLLRIPGIARFLLTQGRDIAFEPEGETSIADMAIFLTGTALGILLHQRGDIALHASAIAVGGKAVLSLRAPRRWAEST